MDNWTTPEPNRSYQLTCRRKGWRSMDTAPYDERVMVRVGRGITIAHRAKGFGPDGPWADDYASPLNPDGWLPLPDVDECQEPVTKLMPLPFPLDDSAPIENERPPLSLVDFVLQEIRAVSDDAPIPWDLLKDAPVTPKDALELAFLLDVSVARIQEIDQKTRTLP